ncbi:hypothetical protein Tco_0967745 [Tanacetum coccineum]
MDDDGKPLENVEYSGDQGSEDEVESVDNEMACYLASKPSRVRYGTKSLLEQLRKTYVNDDYNPYDDDMYEGQEIPDIIQSICDHLDIKVRDRGSGIQGIREESAQIGHGVTSRHNEPRIEESL